MIEDYSVEGMSDDEYVSADEFFSSDEGMLSDNDYAILGYAEEARVNVIVPYFDFPTPIEIAYHSRPSVAPEVICFPGVVPYH